MRAKSRTPGDTLPRGPESDPRVNKRRGFLLALGAGGIGAAAIAARTLSGGAPALEPGAADATAGEGYRVTDHVQRYYRTAKI